MSRYARQVDTSHAPIRDALRKAGLQVIDASRVGDGFPDLLVHGRHSVCRIGLGGRTVYEAWRTRAHPAGPSLLATGLATAEEAQARCLDDALTAAAVQP